MSKKDDWKDWKAPVLLKAPEWKPGMGRVPYHFADKPVGSRCLWCVRWTVSFEPDKGSRYPYKTIHRVEIRDWERIGWEMGKMSDEQLRCELEDVSARPNVFAPKAVELLLNTYPEKAHWRYLTEELLFQARQGYPEAIAPWAEPAEVENRTMRPGWESWPGVEPARVHGFVHRRLNDR